MEVIIQMVVSYINNFGQFTHVYLFNLNLNCSRVYLFVISISIDEHYKLNAVTSASGSWQVNSTIHMQVSEANIEKSPGDEPETDVPSAVKDHPFLAD